MLEGGMPNEETSKNSATIGDACARPTGPILRALTLADALALVNSVRAAQIWHLPAMAVIDDSSKIKAIVERIYLVRELANLPASLND